MPTLIRNKNENRVNLANRGKICAPSSSRNQLQACLAARSMANSRVMHRYSTSHWPNCKHRFQYLSLTNCKNTHTPIFSVKNVEQSEQNGKILCKKISQLSNYFYLLFLHLTRQQWIRPYIHWHKRNYSSRYWGKGIIGPWQTFHMTSQVVHKNFQENHWQKQWYTLQTLQTARNDIRIQI